MPDSALQHEFWAALARGDAEQVRDLAGAGADVNLPIGSADGDTPLIRAVAAGDSDLVRLLLELGANPNLPSKGPRAWTPLMFAHEDPVLLEELIAAGADVNARSSAYWIRSPTGRMKQLPAGETALHLAAAVGKADAVRVLLEAGADPEAQAENGCGPLDYALRLGSVTEAAEALVEAGAQLTPKRLEAMHAAAHSPDSDLLTFPFFDEANSSPPDGPAPQMPPKRERLRPATALSEAGGPRPTELRCPKCHALIYSRKPKLCGQCGALLPPELLLTDQESEARREERRWAQELADKFDARDSTPGRPGLARADRAPTASALMETGAPQVLLRQVSCAEEFQHRARPTFWLYVVGYGFMFFLAALLSFKVRLVPPGFLLLLLGVLAFDCYWAWQRASPVCPNCRQNIKYCPTIFCHRCGQTLNHKRCEACGVDNSWTSFFRPYRTGGGFGWVIFCPGCGARLDSKVLRWRAR
jgi:predicted amidophosphoribosyltransferase